MHDFTIHFYHSKLLHNLYKYIFHLSVSLHLFHSSSFFLASHNNYMFYFFLFSNACIHFLFNPLQNFTQSIQIYFKLFCFFFFSHSLLFIPASHNNLDLYNLMHHFTNHFYRSYFLPNLYQYNFHLSVSLHFSSLFIVILASHNNYLYLFFLFSHACPHFSFNSLKNFTQYTQLYFKSILSLYIFLTLPHLFLHLTILFLFFLTSCLMHALIFNSITFKI